MLCFRSRQGVFLLSFLVVAVSSQDNSRSPTLFVFFVTSFVFPAMSRSFLVVRVVHDPNRFACGLFPGAAAARAELRAHVVLGCITGKVRLQHKGKVMTVGSEGLKRESKMGSRPGTWDLKQ